MSVFTTQLNKILTQEGTACFRDIKDIKADAKAITDQITYSVIALVGRDEFLITHNSSNIQNALDKAWSHKHSINSI